MRIQEIYVTNILDTRFSKHELMKWNSVSIPLTRNPIQISNRNSLYRDLFLYGKPLLSGAHRLANIFCNGWLYAKREFLVARDQWRTSRFGSDRDSVLGKMFTWVSRRRVTAPLGAALCDDLRRYYAQNNKVDSADLYVQRRTSIGHTDTYTVHALPAWNRETYLHQAIIQWILYGSIAFSICDSRSPTGMPVRDWSSAIFTKNFINTGGYYCFLIINHLSVD